MRLAGKTVFVTGAANGIGRSCALAYAREGASLVLADVDLAGARDAASEIGASALAIECDVSRAASVERAASETLARFGDIHALHNNAGIAGPSKPLDETSEEEWDALMAINLKSVFLTVRAFLPALRRTRGTILNTASMVGLIGQSRHAAYTATKGGMITLTKSMALDYAGDGIRVNAICPAAVMTPMLESWCDSQPDPAATRELLGRIHALGYCPKGDEIASAAVFLLSDDARFVTGCILPVSGGAELGYRV